MLRQLPRRSERAPRRPGALTAVAILLVLGSAVAITVTSARAATGTLGLDVSHWNGSLNWAQTAAGGYRFVFVNATEGLTIEDALYPNNRQGAAANGLRLGAYHFARPGGTSDSSIVANAVAQADYFLAYAQPAAGDLPPVLDLEAKGSLTPAQLVRWTEAWLDEVNARIGVRPILYTSPNFWRTALGDTTQFSDAGYVLWIANYTTNPQPLVPAGNWSGRGWTFWQWTNCALIPGLARCGDENRFSGADLGTLAVPTAAPSVTAPVSTAPPAVGGAPVTGQTLSVANGAWTGSPVFAYQWNRCAGGACTPIPGATAATYAPQAADVGATLQVTVTASNSAGSASATSPATAAVTAAPGTTPATPGSAIAAAGQAGTATSADATVSVSWPADALPAGARLSVGPAAPPPSRLVLAGTQITVAVDSVPGGASPAPVTAPLDVKFASAPPPATIAGRQDTDGRWQPIAEQPDAALPVGQDTGTYRDGSDGFHIVTTKPGTFGLFRRGGWGDPNLTGTGPTTVTQAANRGPVVPTREPRGAAALVTTRIRLDGQAHLYVSVHKPSGDRLQLLQKGSRVGWFLTGPPTKTVQALALAPGWRPIRLRVPANLLRPGTTYSLRIVAVDPYGSRSEALTPVRVAAAPRAATLAAALPG